MSSGSRASVAPTHPTAAPMRTMAVGANSRRSITALVNCVVPIMTASMALRSTSAEDRISSRALTTPSLTLREVRTLVAASTFARRAQPHLYVCHRRLFQCAFIFSPDAYVRIPITDKQQCQLPVNQVVLWRLATDPRNTSRPTICRCQFLRRPR